MSSAAVPKKKTFEEIKRVIKQMIVAPSQSQKNILAERLRASSKK